MHEEKRSGTEIAKEGKFLKWLDNYWYHYKWVTIGVSVALIILVVCIAQSCTKEKKDISFVYAGPTVLSASQQQQICDLMGHLLPSDFDENGERVASLTTYHVYSEEQIKEITSHTDENGRPLEVDRGRNSSEYDVYIKYIQTGGSSVYFLDPWLYEDLLQAGLIRPLSEVFDEAPQGAIDEYGIRLGDTDLYENYDVVKLLPEDTIVCLMRQTNRGRSNNDKAYAFETESFRAIVTYTKEEE